MAKIYRAWVGEPDGGGHALKLDGTIVPLDAKPPESQFVDKPAGAPEGDFIQARTGEFEPIGRPGARTARTEFLGEIQDRQNQAERVMAAKLGARMGAKQKLDQQSLSMGYSPVQQRRQAALRDTRAKLEADFGEGKYTPGQMQQFEAEVSRQEALIMPQMQKRQPSPQEQFQSSLVQDPVTGIRYTRKNSGDYAPLAGGLSAVDRMKLAKIAKEAIEAEAIGFDKEGKPNKFAVATVEAVNDWITQFTTNDAQIDAAKSGINTQQPFEVTPDFAERTAAARGEAPAPAPTEAEQKAGTVEEIWQAGLDELAKSTTRVNLRRMEEFGNAFVTEVVSLGMEPDEAIDKFMDLWKKEAESRGRNPIKDRGTFVGPGGPKRGFKRNRLEVQAQVARIEFLRSKVRQ